jgi:hypothetical protein
MRGTVAPAHVARGAECAIHMGDSECPSSQGSTARRSRPAQAFVH